MSGKTKKKRPLPLWRRILLGLILALMVMLAILMLANYLFEKQLCDEIIKISRAGEPLSFSDLQTEPESSGTDEDAADYYNEALSEIIGDDLEELMHINAFYRGNVSSLPAGRFPDELREKVTSRLAPSQPILKNLDKGANVDLRSPVISIEEGMQVCKTRLRRVQAAALLLSLRTLDLILQGQDAAAANSVLSTLKMLRIFEHQPAIIGYVVRTSLVGLVCEDVCLLLEHGRPSAESLAKLQKVLPETIPANILEKVFVTERVYQTEIARNLIPENALQFLGDYVPDLPERLLLPNSSVARLRLRQKAGWYFRDMARLITTARYQWPKPLDEIVATAPGPTKSSSKLMSIGANIIHLTAKTLAAVRCTTLAVAIERYHRSNGELPRSLDEVVPAYIKSVPSDPFTAKGLLYSYDEESYTIYSVGINRQDDKGAVSSGAAGKSSLDLGLRIQFRKPE